MSDTDLREARYEAGRMEAAMQWLAVLAALLGIGEWVLEGWLAGLRVFLLAGLLYGMSRLFAVAVVLLGTTARGSAEKASGDDRRSQAQEPGGAGVGGV